MARNSRSRTNGAKPDDPVVRAGTVYGVPLSSGYTALINQPPMMALMAVQEKAQEKFPEPPMPMITVTVAGKEEEVPVGTDTSEFAAYLDEMRGVNRQRNEWLLEFVFKRYLKIEELNTEAEWDVVIKTYQDEVADLREFADLDAGLTERDVVLRYCLIRTPEEYAEINAIIGLVVNMPELTREEVLKRARSFRRDLAE